MVEVFFYAPLLTLLEKALKDTFTNYVSQPDFANLNISIEYPVDRTAYPGIWVDFEPEGNLETAGMNRVELDPNIPDAALDIAQYQRWRFKGWATYTIGSFSSLERARLVDEMVRIVAFGSEMPDTNTFRQELRNNDLIACEFDRDSMQLRGKGESMRTDWETSDIVYEITIAIGVLGEFISDKHTGQLVNLSKFVLHPWETEHLPPQSTDPPDPFPPGTVSGQAGPGGNPWF